MNRFDNIDCMNKEKGMPSYPDKFFDLAIVDPPYGLGNRLSDGGGKLKNTPMATLYRKSSGWDKKPDDDYFAELFRVSKNQIICGGNYFALPPTRGFVVWDKLNYMPTLSRCEFIWTSFDCPAKIFAFSSMDLSRFHPTQKPIALYKWLLTKYAKTGDAILDTHVGSASSLIACEDMGFEYVGFELDEQYYNDAKKRLENYRKQTKLFTPEMLNV